MNKIALVVAGFIIGLIIAIPANAQQQRLKLDDTCDPALQKELVNRLNSLHLNKAADQKNLSVVVVDITDPLSPRMAYVNPNEMMYAASLPKIAILLGAFDRISHGEMTLDEEALDQFKKMIRNSNNRSATEVLNRVGKDYINALLQSPRYRLYDPEKNGGLWVGKEYGKSPAYQRDPLHNLSHGATAFQVARFYYLLDTGQLVRTDPGDFDNDGFSEARGHFTLQLEENIAKVRIDGRNFMRFSPVFKLVEVAQRDVWIYLDGRLIRDVHRDRDGNVLFELPEVISGEALLEITSLAREESARSPNFN